MIEGVISTYLNVEDTANRDGTFEVVIPFGNSLNHRVIREINLSWFQTSNIVCYNLQMKTSCPDFLLNHPKGMVLTGTGTALSLSESNEIITNRSGARSGTYIAGISTRIHQKWVASDLKILVQYRFNAVFATMPFLLNVVYEEER